MQVGQVQTCRGSHTHTLVTDKHSTKYVYIYVQGTAGRAAAGGARRLRRQQHQRRRPATTRRSGGSRSSRSRVAAPEDAAIVNEPRLFRDPPRAPSTACRTRRRRRTIRRACHGARHPITDACHDITVYPKFEIAAGACEGNGLLIDISEPGQPEADRRRRRPALRLLARGDVQQRRQDGRVHGRVGRRHGCALPCDRPAQLGRQLDLRHRQGQARLPQLLQDPAGPDPAGELRQPHPVAGPGSGSRHLRPGLVSGRRVAGRLQRLEEPGRDRLLRPRADQLGEPRDRRPVVDLLVQRLDLRLGARTWIRRLGPDPDRRALGERDRGG